MTGTYTMATSPAAVPPAPATRIAPTSLFSPQNRQCCQCKNTTPSRPSSAASTPSLSTASCACAHEFCKACATLDARGSPVLRHSFPTDWICSTCGSTHSALEILDGSGVACGCGAPTLQAVYDQFGQLYLYWRQDETVYDLRDPAKAQEAARRFLLAGGDPWLEDAFTSELGSMRARRLSRSSTLSNESLSSTDAVVVD